MFRWSNGRTRSFDKAYPHRLQMAEEEKVELAARQEAAAARAEKRKNPPATGVHAHDERARAREVYGAGVCTEPGRVYGAGTCMEI